MADISLPDRFDSSFGAVACGAVGAGPDVVLVHGTPTSSVIWEQVVARLADRYRLHVLDLPGYGRSAQFEGQDVRLRSLARALAEWLEWKDLLDPVLVGHDFGAAAVLGAHLAEGSPAAGLCVVDGVVLSPWGTPFSRHVKEHETVFAEVPGYIHEAMLRAHLVTGFARTPGPRLVDALVAPWLGESGQRAYYRQVGQYDYEYTDQLTNLYPQLGSQLMILWGEEDPWVDVEVAHRLRNAVPSSVLEVLPDAGHFGMLETPGLFSARLAALLSRVTDT